MVRLPRCRQDGDLRAGLRSHLTALAPVEIVLPAGGLSAASHRALAASAGRAQLRQLAAGEFWVADRLQRHLQKRAYFGSGPAPAALQARDAHLDTSLCDPSASTLASTTDSCKRVSRRRIGMLHWQPGLGGSAR